MNFDKLTDFAITIVLASALAGNLDSFSKWVYVARAKLLYESRTSAWGSAPLPRPEFVTLSVAIHIREWADYR